MSSNIIIPIWKPISWTSFDIVKKAEMVAIINGTAGWEAILNGIPVIHFSDFLFDVLNLSKKCTDLERLPIIINEEINRMKQITSSQRKKRILTLIEAMLEHSFWATYPNQLFYIEPANDKHHNICAKELTQGIIKFMKYLEKEKGNDFKIS